jgi:hypothetical protein
MHSTYAPSQSRQVAGDDIGSKHEYTTVSARMAIYMHHIVKEASGIQHHHTDDFNRYIWD